MKWSWLVVRAGEWKKENGGKENKILLFVNKKKQKNFVHCFGEYGGELGLAGQWRGGFETCGGGLARVPVDEVFLLLFVHKKKTFPWLGEERVRMAAGRRCAIGRAGRRDARRWRRARTESGRALPLAHARAPHATRWRHAGCRSRGRKRCSSVSWP